MGVCTETCLLTLLSEDNRIQRHVCQNRLDFFSLVTQMHKLQIMTASMKVSFSSLSLLCGSQCLGIRWV